MAPQAELPPGGLLRPESPWVPSERRRLGRERRGALRWTRDSRDARWADCHSTTARCDLTTALAWSCVRRRSASVKRERRRLALYSKRIDAHCTRLARLGVYVYTCAVRVRLAMASLLSLRRPSPPNCSPGDSVEMEPSRAGHSHRVGLHLHRIAVPMSLSESFGEYAPPISLSTSRCVGG